MESRYARWYNCFMPIYEYQCEDCQTRYEKLVMAKGRENFLPEVR